MGLLVVGIVVAVLMLSPVERCRKCVHGPSSKGQGTDDDFDFTDTMRSAFREAEKSQDADWAIALSFYPDLEDIYKRLKRISDKLAFAFRSTVLEGKQFSKRDTIADNYGKAILTEVFW